MYNHRWCQDKRFIHRSLGKMRFQKDIHHIFHRHRSIDDSRRQGIINRSIIDCWGSIIHRRRSIIDRRRSMIDRRWRGGFFPDKTETLRDGVADEAEFGDLDGTRDSGLLYRDNLVFLQEGRLSCRRLWWDG